MPVLPEVLALAGGTFVFLGVVIAIFFAVVFGFFTIGGSGIDKHPNDGLGGAPGSEGPSEASGEGRSSGSTSDGHGSFSTHGTG